PSARRLALAATVVAGAAAVIIATPDLASAAPGDAATTADLQKLSQGTNLLWIVAAAALVMFMQAGFALLETGFCRAKNAAHTMSMNIAVFGMGALGFFLCGYAFMFGGYFVNVPGADWGYTSAIGGNLIGSGQWVFLWKGGFLLGGLPNGVPPGAILGFFLY